MFEGDILLTKQEEDQLRAAAMNDGPEERAPSLRGRGSRSGLKSSRTRWPGGVLTYEFGDTFSKKDKEYVKKVMQEFQDEISDAFPPVRECISFKEGDRGNRVFFIGPKEAVSCSSSFGLQKLGTLKLGPQCLTRSTIKHELMHSLGIYHQQSRSDRDDHVKILWKNIDEKFLGQFNKYHPAYIDAHGVPYDLMSMMHYTTTMASKNSNPTIQTLDKNAQDITRWNFELGRMARLTDIELIRRMYKCDKLDKTKLVSGSNKFSTNDQLWVTRFFEKKSLKLRNNQHATTLPTLPNEWRVNFKLLPKSIQRRGQNILQMTSGNRELILAVSVDPRRLLGLRINKGKQKHDIPEVFSWRDSININNKGKWVQKWTEIEILQELRNDRMILSVAVDGLNQFTSETNKEASKNFIFFFKFTEFGLAKIDVLLEDISVAKYRGRYRSPPPPPSPGFQHSEEEIIFKASLKG